MSHIRRMVFAAIGLAIVFAPLAAAQQISRDLYQGMRWRLIGPFRGGRTKAIAGVPSEPNVFYIAQVDGGVWKSTDYGETWKPIFDAEPTGSVGAIAVAPSDPNIVYVGSGEGLQRPDLSVGDGIYKSTDAGKTWTHLGLDDAQQITQLAIDPHDPSRVFVAVFGHPYGPSKQRGIFRSTNGGTTWQRVLYKDENTGGGDVEIDPSNPSVVYASLWDSRQGPWEYDNIYNGPNGGLYKSTDGGNTWRQLTTGLPKDLVQVDVAIAPSEPTRLYATVATTHSGVYGSGQGLGIYRSDDAGKSWYRATTDDRPAARIGGGDLPVPKVDPKDPNVVYVASIVTWKSADGGKTWTGIRGAPGGDDYQNIWINPNHPNIILLSSDQGAIVTVNGGKTWSSWYNQPTAQFYHVITDNRFPYWVYGGQQESGSIGIESRGNDGEITFREWHPVGAEEYAYVAPDPLNPNIIYGAGVNDVTKFNRVTGQVQKVSPIPMHANKYRVDRTQPILFSPVDPHILYYAANVLFKTTNGGQSWQTISPDLTRKHPGIPPSLGDMAKNNPEADKKRGVIYAVGPSFKDVNLIWVGTDDGLIWVTRDGGTTWRNVTPPELGPWSKVTQIVASHFDTETAYASVSRFRIDDLRPYIYRTYDGGRTWQTITKGLPANAPVDTVREDPVRKGLLFAGTENAVWVSFDDGDHWQSLQLNLPHTAMRDLWIHDNDLIVGTHGRSFWILDDVTPLRQLSESVAKSAAYLFKPETAYRMRRDTNTDTPLPPEVPAGQNPPDGALIDYYLAKPASGPVTLEILGPAGKLVRRYASTDTPPVTEAELERTLTVPVYWVKFPKILSDGAGMHRWVWDLHYPPPDSLHHEYPISAIYHDTPRYPLGPRALPGEYTVKLTLDGRTYSQPLEVKMDPRVHATPAALAGQFAVEMKITGAMHQDYEAHEHVRSLGEQLKKLAPQAQGSLSVAIAALEKKAEALTGAPEGFFAPPGGQENLALVNANLADLYGQVDSADAMPTAAQTAALASLEQKLAALLAQWNAVQQGDIPALNHQLDKAHLPAMDLKLSAPPGNQIDGRAKLGRQGPSGIARWESPRAQSSAGAARRAKRMTLAQARKALRAFADPEKASVYRGFFKATNDVFLGVTTPRIRQVARDF